MKDLQKKIVSYKEVDSVRILESKIDQERTYLQNSIIENEIKQIAESITRVTHAKKISSSGSQKSSFAEMVLEKYGPPIARKTRHMAQDEGFPKRSSRSPTPIDNNEQSSEELILNSQNIGIANRPLALKMHAGPDS